MYTYRAALGHLSPSVEWIRLLLLLSAVGLGRAGRGGRGEGNEAMWRDEATVGSMMKSALLRSTGRLTSDF